MIESLKKRVAREESGFTLIELLVVIIILGILIAIAVPSYLSFKDRANKSAAQSDVRALVPSVESYNSDNTGNTGDPDGNASTTGYNGMSLSNLKSNYDQSIDATSGSVFAINPTGFTGTPDLTSDYCITATVGGWTAFKHGPAGVIGVTKTTAFAAANCA